MKARLLLIVMVAVFSLAILATAVSAQGGETPPPYAGLKNPFPWDDAGAQSAGATIFQRNCQGCHGAGGSNITQANFGAAGFPQEMEGQPDYYFWQLSEGNLKNGMPPFKSSLSEEQRWQLLVYLHYLSQAAPPEAPPPVAPPPEAGPEAAFTLRLLVPERAPSGEPMMLTVVLRDDREQPVVNAAINFSVKVDFFASGLLDIGQATTDENGAAVIEYVPRYAGDMEIHASYNTLEIVKTASVFGPDKAFYQTVVGLVFPSLGPGKFIYLEEPDIDLEDAPPTVFRLPTGRLFWLAPMLWVAMIIWIAYFYVMYQIFRIPVVGDVEDNSKLRRIPIIGLMFITVVGIGLILMLVTSPISNV